MPTKRNKVFFDMNSKNTFNQLDYLWLFYYEKKEPIDSPFTRSWPTIGSNQLRIQVTDRGKTK